MVRISKNEILDNFRKQVSLGIPIVGAGAGVGISARCVEEGGADLIIIYSSGRYRMAGHSSMVSIFPTGDSNHSMYNEIADEVMSVVKHTPIIAGINATDPFIDMQRFLEDIAAKGFSGVQNFPTVGYTPLSKDEVKLGFTYEKEIEMLKIANKLGLLTTPYCFDEKQAVDLAEMGCDILVAHMGLTSKGLIGSTTAKPLDLVCEKLDSMIKAAKKVNPDVLIIAHGGPIAEPEDTQYIYDRVEGLAGFYGASSAERLPTEDGIISVVKEFKQIRIGGR